ncbi:MAG: GGDEF domain-containing protein [Clostridia bacterium]|nr:GGDEF domain-containing protein [Clostridia bacterium]
MTHAEMFTSVCVSNGIGLFMLIMLLFTNREHFSVRKHTKYLLYMVYVAMASCCADMIAYGIDGKPGWVITVLIYLVNSWLFCGVILVTYFWLRLGNDFLGASMSKIGDIAIFSLDALGLLALVVNLFVPLVFSVENNIYKRETFYWIFVFIGGVNLLYGLFTYYTSMKKGQLAVSFSVAVFALPAAISVLIQSIFYGISVVWVGISIAIMGILSTFKNKLIYYDSLTHTYNVYYLQELTNEYEHKDNVVLTGISIDINDFKKINDVYGHDAGDDALIGASEMFVKAVGNLGNVIRCGGDEFLLLINTTDEAAVDEIIRKIEDSCETFNEDARFEFNLSVSMGRGVFDSKTQSFDNFRKTLDFYMYENKQRYHRLHDKSPSER